MADEYPFGFMLRRPGDTLNVYRAPGYDEPARNGSDPRWGENAAQNWSLSLPHQCDEWAIADGERVDVLAEARRFRFELDQAIAALEAASD